MLKLLRKMITGSANDGPRWEERPRIVSAEFFDPESGAAREWELRLIPLAERWVESLPSDCRPMQLCESFPRIANRLSMLWPNLTLVDAYFDDLLVDTRGGRQGFPGDIAQELLNLRVLRNQTDYEAGPRALPLDTLKIGPGLNDTLPIGPMEQTIPNFQPRF